MLCDRMPGIKTLKVIIYCWRVPIYIVLQQKIEHRHYKMLCLYIFILLLWLLSKLISILQLICLYIIDFQKLRALFKSCVHFSKVACTFQKLRATFKSYVHFLKVARRFQKLRALFEKCAQLLKSARTI